MDQIEQNENVERTPKKQEWSKFEKHSCAPQIWKNKSFVSMEMCQLKRRL